MNDQKIFYKADLAKLGRKLSWIGWGGVLVCLTAGVGLTWHFGSIEGCVPAFSAFFAFIFSLVARRGFSLLRHSGVYRIAIDDYGLYVHSDDPESAPSFSIPATDICRLVRKTIKDTDDSDNYKYYVETKSGRRHRVDHFFASHGLDMAKLFGEITGRFHWVVVHEEVEDCSSEERERIFRGFLAQRAHEWQGKRGIRRLVARVRIELWATRETNREWRAL